MLSPETNTPTQLLKDFRKQLADYLLDFDTTVEAYTSSPLHIDPVNNFLYDLTNRAFNEYVESSKGVVNDCIQTLGGIPLRTLVRQRSTDMTLTGIHEPIYGRPGFNNWFTSYDALPHAFRSTDILKYLLPD